MDSDGVRADSLRRELAHALRTGPFSAVLHLAIEASGLRLDEIQGLLADQGLTVSPTTLSYWRRGRSRPERPDSLRAIRALEKILGLPPESLMSQLGPRRPRGRWLSHPPGTLEVDRLLEDPISVGRLLAEHDTPIHNGVTRLSLHDVYTVGPNREEISLSVRQVLRATADRVSRCLAIFKTDDREAPIPQVHAVRNCRLGRVRSDVESGFVVAELVFDRVLGAGDTTVVEHEVIIASAQPTTTYHRGFLVPIGEYVLQVQFDHTAVPARCYRYERRTELAPEQGVREVWIGNTSCAHVVAQEVPPGVIGMRWEWQ